MNTPKKSYPNSGIVFHKRNDADDDRNYEGSGETTCPSCGQITEFWINGWNKTSKKNGAPFVTLKFKHKDARGKYPDPAPSKPYDPGKAFESKNRPTDETPDVPF